jgi:hypothetical protein
MENINPKELEAFIRMKEAEAANATISQSDGMVIRKSEGNVPGFYVTAEQRLQDNFAQQIAMQNAPGKYGKQGDRSGFGTASMADMNTRPVPMQNPNASTAEPVRITADETGRIIIY